jgi:hypothetical protein
LIIIAGWAAGFAIGGFIAWEIGFEFAVDYVYGALYGHDPGLLGFIALVIISAQAGAVAGFLGGAATISQLWPATPLESEDSLPAADAPENNSVVSSRGSKATEAISGTGV